MAGQERGLRPLHPLLPAGWESRAIRISMPRPRWEQFDALAAMAGRGGETGARMAGRALIALMDAATSAGRGAHWLDWEREKAQRLLRATGRAA